jgi:hypothetical protein
VKFSKEGVTRIGRQRAWAASLVLVVTVVSVVTGWLWPIAIDQGGESAGNPIARYGPHWLFTVVLLVVVAALLGVLLSKPQRIGAAAALTAFAAGGASNLMQWVILGHVSNPIGPVPGLRGPGHLSIGDLMLLVGVLVLAGQGMAPRRRRPDHEPESGYGN